MKPIEVHLILPIGLQAGDGDLILITPDGHCLGPPLGILVLDHEGVERALGHCPGEAQGVCGGASHCQLPQQGLLWGFCMAGLLFLLWGCK